MGGNAHIYTTLVGAATLRKYDNVTKGKYEAKKCPKTPTP